MIRIRKSYVRKIFYKKEHNNLCLNRLLLLVVCLNWYGMVWDDVHDVDGDDDAIDSDDDIKVFIGIWEAKSVILRTEEKKLHMPLNFLIRRQSRVVLLCFFALSIFKFLFIFFWSGLLVLIYVCKRGVNYVIILLLGKKEKDKDKSIHLKSISS